MKNGNQSEQKFNSTVRIVAIFEITDTVAIKTAQDLSRLPQENVDIVDIVKILGTAYGENVVQCAELELEFTVKGETVELQDFIWNDI